LKENAKIKKKRRGKRKALKKDRMYIDRMTEEHIAE